MSKKPQKGKIDWSSDNYVMFTVIETIDEETDSGDSHTMEFASDPLVMAKRLRDAAAFLEAHAGEHIEADID